MKWFFNWLFRRALNPGSAFMKRYWESPVSPVKTAILTAVDAAIASGVKTAFDRYAPVGVLGNTNINELTTQAIAWVNKEVASALNKL